MFKIAELLRGCEYSVICGDGDKNVSGAVCDTRKTEEGCLFICIKGSSFDAHDAAAAVIEAGAGAVIGDDEEKLASCAELAEKKGVSLLLCADSRAAAAAAACARCARPAEKLFTIGVTGTKGKSTTVSLIRSALEECGIKTGLVGTIEIYDGKDSEASLNTTPDAFKLQDAFARMVDNGCRAAVMEVSSQGLMMKRVAGFTFDVGIFTNLSPDHIGPGEHKDFEDYLECKKLLFAQCKTGFYNADDEYAPRIMEGCSCEKSEGFGRSGEINFREEKLCSEDGKLGVSFILNDGEISENVRFMQPGIFSIYNALAAYSGTAAALRALDKEKFSVGKIFDGFNRAWVKGRIEMLPVSNDYTMMIDYAHNAMALKSLLTTIREYEPGRLVTLFGCGGNRAKSRRYEMGEEAGKLSDMTVITSDNPRNEEPMDIINDIVSGMEKTEGRYVTIPDRKEAIRYCYENAKPGDIIILAGKGHEDYQEIKGVKHHMDERELVMEILKEAGDSEALRRMEERYPGVRI
ncbi:MAG: UDP-N-acetylmuramoyl-L-alanyl-D-glutamate--2,6-diaminopimelate ligase [Lachnospiraceae bacterium]|nr:UDP-N-acetylmuramoyl-L-alanyl-D-glutamate--2,6-diaminopimelate ligase [Lachnospiraceae bacterium]